MSYTDKSTLIYSFIPYQHFKVKGLQLLKDLVQNINYLCKTDLKRCFVLPTYYDIDKKIPKVLMGSDPVPSPVLELYLGPAPLTFIKLLKVLIALSTRLMIRMILFLNGLFLIRQNLKELIMVKTSLI